MATATAQANATTDKSQPRGRMIADYVAASAGRNFPAEIIDAAKVALIDHVGVAVGACNEPAALAARSVALSWRATGHARIFNGPTTSAGLAALVNGTAAHCMDFDDTHIHGSGHISAPCWSASYSSTKPCRPGSRGIRWRLRRSSAIRLLR